MFNKVGAMLLCQSVMIVNHRIIKEFKNGKSPRSYHFFCNSDQQPIQQQQQGQQQQQLEKPIGITLSNIIGEKLRIESVWDEWYSCYTTHIVRDKSADAIVDHVLTQFYSSTTDDRNFARKEVDLTSEYARFFITFDRIH